MGFDNVLSRLNKASQATEAYIKKRWETRRVSEADRRRIEERNRFLQLVAAKVTGSSKAEMPPLVCSYNPAAPPDAVAPTHSKAVFLVTVPIAFGRFELSRSAYKLLARHFGMSLNSVSHWALCVVDRRLSDNSDNNGEAPAYCYDLMSDHVAPIRVIGRNYFRVDEITPNFIAIWSSCYYVGETTKSHDVIQQLGNNFIAVYPRYNLVSNNCQDLVESLVRLLCDGKVISQPKLNEELSLISPKIARDLMVARLRSKLDAANEQEDEHEQEQREDVKEDLDVIKALWEMVHR